MKKASLQIFTAILALGLLFSGTAAAVPSISGDVNPNQNSTVTGTVGDTQDFTIPLNESADVIWTVNGSDTTRSTDSSNISTLSHEIQSGSYQITASIDGVGQIAAWNVTGTEGAPVITLSDPSSSSVSDNVGDSRTFTATVSRTSDMTWSLDGVDVQTNSSVDSSSYTNSSAVEGTHTLTVNAVDGNGTAAESKSWTWTVSSSSSSGDDEIDVEIDPSDDTIEMSEGESQTFYVNATDSPSYINVEWFVNNETEASKTEDGVTSSSYDFEPDTSGTYNIEAVVTDPDDNYDSVTKTWNVTVQSKYYLSGNRIWDEDLGLSTTYTWNAQSYSGFYYDLDSGESSEEMTITDIGRNIDEGDIEYITKPTETDFEYNDWGSYQIIGFMAEKYFAGYTDNTTVDDVDDVSLISDGVLSKILIDSDDKESAYTGDSFELEDGYALDIVEVDVNGEIVWVQLEKDGDVVDDNFIASGDDYIYETELGDAEDVPIIIVHFGTVFAGEETSAVFTQGIFQISDEYIEINNGDSFDEMEISSVSESGITMKNDDDIGLDDDETIDIMGDVKFKTADDSTLRFYPFVEVETGSDASRELSISVPDDIIVGDTFDIEVTAEDEPVEGVTVKVNTSTIGETDADGLVEYTAEEVGTFKITATKDDYTTANKNMEVNVEKEKMSLNVSPETVYVGDTITIEALKTIGGDPIEGANVSVDGDLIGETDSDGQITYTTEEVGKIKISASGEGFIDKSTEVNVKDYEAIFEFSNLVVDPIEVTAGKEATITIDAENTGNAAGEYDVELIVNDSSVDSQQISLDVGQSTTVTFEHIEEAPGSYTVEIEGQEATYTVKEKSSILLYALIAIILLLGGGIAYMFTKGGMDASALQAKMDELIRSVKK